MAEQRPRRRLAAIFAADVVGYTRLMDQDEAGTLTRLKTLRADKLDPLVEKYGGRIFKNTGDGVLVEFASATDAVQSAFEIQTALTESQHDIDHERRIVLRIGVSLGDVIVEGDDLFGNGVNVAARMETLAKPGRICISGNVHEHVASSMDFAFEDLGAQSVKNLERPVQAYNVVLDAPLATPADLPGRPSASPTTAPALPDKPSIAVLPFQNMSGDEEQEFFADGMSEDIITGLSHYRSLFVIARNSTFAYKGRSPDLREVARDLGVKYVLEGSIRKGGNRIRITGQLIEGASGNHIWAERNDRDLDDIFAVQDEITEAIVAAIGPEIDSVEREQAQRLPPENLDVWESYQRGLWHLYRFSASDNAEGQRLFRRAIDQAPQFAPAYSGLTHALYYAYMHGHGDDPKAVLDAGYAAGRNAVAFDERDAEGHFALGRILYLRHDHDASMAEFEAAIALNPSLTHAHVGLGTALFFSSLWDPAIESLDRAERLSPHDPLNWLINTAKALAHMGARRHGAAEACARLATRQPTAAITAYLCLAATLATQGKEAEAVRAMAEVFAKKPDVNGSYVAQVLPYRDPDELAYLIDALHKAGMPR